MGIGRYCWSSCDGTDAKIKKGKIIGGYTVSDGLARNTIAEAYHCVICKKVIIDYS